MEATIVSIEGAGEVRRRLKAFDDGVTDLKTLHLRIASEAARLAKQRLPVRTGRLRDSVRPSGTKTAAIVRWGRKSVPYGGPIEFGGYPKFKNGASAVPFQPEGRYIYPAIEAFAPRAYEQYRAELGRLARKFNL